MPGDIKDKYVASVAATVTNLHSLASSQDWLTGWCSGYVTNTTNNYLDYLYAAAFTTHASNRQVGSINVYLINALNDTPLWPASATGTVGAEGALTFTDAEERDSACTLIGSITVDATASSIVYLKPVAISPFSAGELATHHCLYISQNASTTTTAGLAAADSVVYYTPKIKQYT